MCTILPAPWHRQDKATLRAQGGWREGRRKAEWGTERFVAIPGRGLEPGSGTYTRSNPLPWPRQP